MSPNNGHNPGSNQPQRHVQKMIRGEGQRYVLSARAQSVLTWILEDVIAKTLEDAGRLAEAAGKQRLELPEVEEALKRLCERYRNRWSSETAKSKSRKHKPKRF